MYKLYRVELVPVPVLQEIGNKISNELVGTKAIPTFALPQETQQNNHTMSHSKITVAK